MLGLLLGATAVVVVKRWDLQQMRPWHAVCRFEAGFMPSDAVYRRTILHHMKVCCSNCGGDAGPHVSWSLQEEEWERASQAVDPATDQHVAEPSAPSWPSGSGEAASSAERTAAEADGRVMYPPVNYVRPSAPPSTAPRLPPRSQAEGATRLSCGRTA